MANNVEKHIEKANLVAAGSIRALDKTQSGGATTFDKVSAYTNAYLSAGVGNYSDLNDASVLIKGQNMDGSKATTIDHLFAAGGLLLPVISGSGVKKGLGDIVNSSLDKIKENFVDGFKYSFTRKIIDQGHDVYLQKLKSIIGNDTKFSQLLGGSFLSKKSNPDDIDMVIYIPHDVYDKHHDTLLELRDYARKYLNVDANHKPFYPLGHKQYQRPFIKELEYWLDIFSKDDKTGEIRDIHLIEH